ncbi:hypothetical protein GCM10027085_50480 [Spirosoma aerophilum]
MTKLQDGLAYTFILPGNGFFIIIIEPIQFPLYPDTQQNRHAELVGLAQNPVGIAIIPDPDGVATALFQPVKSAETRYSLYKIRLSVP